MSNDATAASPSPRTPLSSNSNLTLTDQNQTRCLHKFRDQDLPKYIFIESMYVNYCVKAKDDGPLDLQVYLYINFLKT